MKKMVGMLLVFLLVLSWTVSALADDDCFELGKRYVESVLDCTDRLVTTGEVDYTFDYDIAFFMQEGNKYVGIRSDYQSCSYHPVKDNDYVPVSDDELYSAFYHLITLFDEIQSELPSDKKLSLSLYSTDGSYTVTSDTIVQFYPWLMK